MGEVKETVSGKGLKTKKLRKSKIAGKNLIEMFQNLREEVSRLTEIKDDDALTEGDDAKPENTRKAATLRAVHSLLTSAQVLLEDY